MVDLLHRLDDFLTDAPIPVALFVAIIIEAAVVVGIGALVWLGLRAVGG